jgi:hypothetical protein
MGADLGRDLVPSATMPMTVISSPSFMWPKEIAPDALHIGLGLGARARKQMRFADDPPGRIFTHRVHKLS